MLRSRLQQGNVRLDHLNPQTQKRLIRTEATDDDSDDESGRAARSTKRMGALARRSAPRGRAYADAVRELAP